MDIGEPRQMPRHAKACIGGGLWHESGEGVGEAVKRTAQNHPCKLCQGHFFYKRYLFFFITKQTLHLNFQFRLILGLYVKKNPPVCLDANLEPSGVVCEKAYSFPFSIG